MQEGSEELASLCHQLAHSKCSSGAMLCLTAQEIFGLFSSVLCHTHSHLDRHSASTRSWLLQV